jgi:hypothetical protein
MANVRRFVPPGGTGSLVYDYHKLARWFWKVHYNTARADKGQPSLYHPLVRYILGDDDDAPQPQTLFVGVLKAYKTTPAERAKHRWAVIFPRAVRAADVTLGPFQHRGSLCRSLSLNSYVFWSILWRKDFPRSERRLAVASLAEHLDMSVLTARGGTISLRESSYPGFEVRAYLSKSGAMGPALKHFRQ